MKITLLCVFLALPFTLLAEDNSSLGMALYTPPQPEIAAGPAPHLSQAGKDRVKANIKTLEGSLEAVDAQAGKIEENLAKLKEELETLKTLRQENVDQQNKLSEYLEQAHNEMKKNETNLKILGDKGAQTAGRETASKTLEDEKSTHLLWKKDAQTKIDQAEQLLKKAETNIQSLETKSTEVATLVESQNKKKEELAALREGFQKNKEQYEKILAANSEPKPASKETP